MPQQTLELTEFQQRVMLTPEDCNLFLGGGRGGGKSFALALLFLRHAEQHGVRAKMLFLRQTFPGVTDFVAVTREVFGLAYGSAASYNAADHMWRLPGGATLQLEQMETISDFQKYQGKSFSLIAVDEAGHYADPAVIDIIRSCLRAPMPMVPRMVLAANPGGPGHGWLSRRHVYKARAWQPYVEETTGVRFINCPSVYVDNPHLDQDQYGKELDAATALDPELGRAWKFGDWSVARGAYFSAVIDQSKVMLDAVEPGEIELVGKDGAPADGWALTQDEQRLRAQWELQREAARQKRVGYGYHPFKAFLAHDFGVTAPSVTYLVAESPGTLGPGGRFYPRGSMLLLDELATNEPGSLSRGMGYTVDRLAEEIQAFAARWGIKPDGVADDAIFGNTGSSAGTIADEFRRKGVYFIGAAKGERVGGWERMRRMLADAGKPDVPGLYVSSACAYWWETVPTLPRDPRKPDDVDSRAADHAADATRYAIVGKAVYVPPTAYVSHYTTTGKASPSIGQTPAISASPEEMERIRSEEQASAMSRHDEAIASLSIRPDRLTQPKPTDPAGR